MQIQCCVCLEDFIDEKIFRYDTIIDEKKNNNLQKKKVNYQLNCSCNGSIYHLECIQKVILYSDKCCYCRRIISDEDKLKINNIFEEDKKNIEIQKNIDNLIINHNKKITKYIVNLSILINIIFYLIEYYLFNKILDNSQKINIISTIFNLRLILWLEHEITHHEPLRISMVINSLEALYYICSEKHDLIKLFSMSFFFIYPIVMLMF